MSRITWDEIDKRFFEAGVDHAVLYLESGGEFVDGVPWSGITSVDRKTAFEQPTSLYGGDDVKSDFEVGPAELSGTIKAYTYPDEFEEVLGVSEFTRVPGVYVGQQENRLFGLCYRTLVGDAVDGTGAAYKLHILYNLYITEDSRAWESLTDNPSASTFSYPFSTIPVDIGFGYKSTSELIIDSRSFRSDLMLQLEEILYGTEDTEPRLPFPDELVDMLYIVDTVELTVSGNVDEYQFTNITNKTFRAGKYMVEWDLASDLSPNCGCIITVEDPYLMADSDYLQQAGYGYFVFTISESKELLIRLQDDSTLLEEPNPTSILIRVLKIG